MPDSRFCFWRILSQTSVFPTQGLTRNYRKKVTLLPKADYDDDKDRLGDLTLLEKPINIVASNDFYADKQDEYCKSGNYLTRSIVELVDVGRNTSISRINEKLKAFSAWNVGSIEKRHEILIALARDVWKTTPMDE